MALVQIFDNELNGTLGRVWKSVECCGMRGVYCGIFPHLVRSVGRDVVEFQFVVQCLSVYAQQLCRTAFVVAGLP